MRAVRTVTLSGNLLDNSNFFFLEFQFDLKNIYIYIHTYTYIIIVGYFKTLPFLLSAVIMTALTLLFCV